MREALRQTSIQSQKRESVGGKSKMEVGQKENKNETEGGFVGNNRVIFPVVFLAPSLSLLQICNSSSMGNQENKWSNVLQ